MRDAQGNPRIFLQFAMIFADFKSKHVVVKRDGAFEVGDAHIDMVDTGYGQNRHAWLRERYPAAGFRSIAGKAGGTATPGAATRRGA